MKQITVNDKGVYVQESYYLTPYGITKRRRLIQGQILRLRRKIQDTQLSVRSMEKEINNLEEQLKTLNSPLVDAYLEKDRQEKEEANLKARQMLKEFIGDTLFQELELKKHIVFQAKDEMVYKIDDDGRIFRKSNREWQRLCVIHPKDLPLPDFLLSLFVSVRENPKNYQLRRR